jgi:hypothetical protein
MLEETGFITREEGDEFLILTCPACRKRIIFTQQADPGVIRETASTHAGRCATPRGHRSRMAGTAVAGR